MEEYYLLTFDNTHGAMNAESVFIVEKIKSTMMPTPTYITRSCGLSLKVGREEISKIKILIGEEKIKIKKIYVKENNSFNEIEI